ncbi:MAG: DUF262 domain-containing protein [Chloroflexota bacterium]|nr:DUF262 domain-containing protein [Chloroflexota bacterium]
MSLGEEIEKASKEIVNDGYDMSLGELITLYNEKELIINPEFQRLFRWKETQKSKFIESILLDIPIPAIFVFTTDEGTWELVDGLQRLSTVFEFVGILRKTDGTLEPPSVLRGTELLPSLKGISWKAGNGTHCLTNAQQFQLRRRRIRVEILKRSHPQSKYELFQRLNSGSVVTNQEVRNCVMMMMNPDFFRWVKELGEFPSFKNVWVSSKKQEKTQHAMELILRFIVYRNVTRSSSDLDVNAYLDKGTLELAKLALNKQFDLDKEGSIFKETFSLIDKAFGKEAFKRYDKENNRFLGPSLISAYEVIAIGVSKSLVVVQKQSEEDQIAFVQQQVKKVWEDPTFKKYAKAGIGGATRLSKLLPLSEHFSDL